MKINFLVGSLVLRENKTGVHLYYDNIIQKCILNHISDLKISVYESYKSLSKRYLREIPYQQYLCTSFRFARVLTYFLPIELFFGCADIYICDGLSPKTLFKSKRVFVIHDLMVYLYPQNYTFAMKVYLKFFRRQQNVTSSEFWVSRKIVFLLFIMEWSAIIVKMMCEMKYIIS